MNIRSASLSLTCCVPILRSPQSTAFPIADRAVASLKSISTHQRCLASSALRSFSTTTGSSSTINMSAKNEASTPTTDTTYTPPTVWKWENPDPKAGNQPTAGARFEQVLPVGEHDIQLYSMATPNGQKITIFLEELLASGQPEASKAEYDAWLIHIIKQDQFGSGFVKVNPNSKIPAMVDKSVAGADGNGLRIFESGSILVYLAEKYDVNGVFFPRKDQDLIKHVETLNWLFWQVGSAPFLGGGFGHFVNYAPVKIQYAIDRFTMETKRQLDVLNRQLENSTYIAGDTYSVADIAIWTWYGQLVLGKSYGDAATFLNVNEEYPHVIRWATLIADRPAVQRGIKVNRAWGPPEDQVVERHSSSDFDKVVE